MIEVRIHSRGGQGGVTFAQLLAKAAGYDGKYSQGFSAFGCERRGAPVRAFCRISESPITIRSQVYEPDHVIVLDPTLLGLPDVREGLKEDSLAIINSKNQENLDCKTINYDATSIALEVLGKDIVNTAMLGAFAGVTGIVSLESLIRAVGDVFPGNIGEANKELVKRAHKEVVHYNKEHETAYAVYASGQ